MGSLGFLCPFDFENFKGYVNSVVKGGVPLLLRNRLKCKLEKSFDSFDEKIDDPINSSLSKTHVFNSSRFIDSSYIDEEDLKSEISFEWLSLNEVVISRGPSPYLSNLDLYINDYLIITVQGDGLIISTPTGKFYGLQFYNMVCFTLLVAFNILLGFMIFFSINIGTFIQYVSKKFLFEKTFFKHLPLVF